MPADLDPIENVFYAFARGFAMGLVDGLAQDGPALVTSLIKSGRVAFRATLEDSAPPPQAEVDAHAKAVADALKTGVLPPTE